ncbi:MAG: hypothetical protein EOL95_12320 [Bacteroidia bacterium]|nr:hypothetical protein [Bacteroidia bacterium]NCU30573.1 hypothetical protein [Candidatus Saccharibacteria bacterium]
MKLSIVSYLDPESSHKVRELQQKLSDITGSRVSLSSWEPHVTIGDGVEVDYGDLKSLKYKIDSLSIKTDPFELNLQGIGSLDNWKGGSDETPYVIYLNVVLTEELMKFVNEIESICNKYNKWYFMPRPYMPHCTLAFRDLTKVGYENGLKYLQKVDPKLKAKIDHIALVEKLTDFDSELIRFKFVK